MIPRPAAMVVVAFLVLACSAPAAVGTSPPASVAATAASVTPAATAAPATSSPSPAQESATPEASGSPESSSPPQATISVEGGDPVVGQLGTYTWADGGSDSPWLPGAPIKAAAGESVTVTLEDNVGVGMWTARRVPAGAEGGSGASRLAGGNGSPVTFAAPPKGSWSVQVTIQFAGDLGSAIYYWRLDVT